MSHVLIHSDNALERWTIDRSSRGNALGVSVAHDLNAALDLLAAKLTNGTPKPRVLVLTAAPIVKGERRTWIAGGDLKELAALTTQAQGAHYAASLSAFLTGLDELPIPVVVAVDGAAIGGGAELALGGDIRIATRSSSFVFKQLEVGLATGYGGARRLVELVGLSRAQDLIFGARTLTAEAALTSGLVHEVVDDERALARRVDERVQMLVSLAAPALTAQKQMFWHAARSHPGAARAGELAAFQAAWGNATHRRFLDAFVDKHKGPSP